MLAQIARQAQAILAGQADIQQHQVGKPLLQCLAQRLAIGTAAHLAAMAAQIVLQQLTHLDIVVHHQDPQSSLHALRPPVARLSFPA
ncbi:hypothetical protein D3C80_2093270 [compost metagenome]